MPIVGNRRKEETFAVKILRRTLLNLYDRLAARFRTKRFEFFKSLASSIPRPIRILDVGGTQKFWEGMNFTNEEDIEIVLLNLSEIEVCYPNFRSVAGDATKMDEFADNEFDIVFSNAVIAHVGEYEDQCCMAEEVKRVGERYFIQTPNRFFPIEPRFIFPFFQFLPSALQVFLVRYSNFLMCYPRRAITDKQDALDAIDFARLLTKKELKAMFPGESIYKEKLLGMTKSLIVYDGWDANLRRDSLCRR